MGLIDYYELLEIPVNATEQEVTSAFRKFARIYHPDVNSSEEAEQKFRDLYLAYSVLSDPLERRKYDDQLFIEKRKRESGQFSYDPFSNFGRPRRRGNIVVDMEYENHEYNIVELERPADVSPSNLRRNLFLHALIITLFVIILWLIFKLTTDPDPIPPRSFFRLF
jgi:DnaJ-class molecular chaperone